MRMRIFLLMMLAVSLLAACASDPALNPANPMADVKRRTDIRLELATAYFSGGKYAIALDELDRALQLSPERADVLGLRGLTLMQLGEPERALESLQKAMRQEPDNPDLQNNMGWFLCETGQAAKAMPLFEKALAQRNYASPAKALLNAGSCSLKLGDKTRAEQFFLRAVELEPDMVMAQARLAQLTYERGDYTRARRHSQLVIASSKAVPEHFLMAILIERKLGDGLAEQSLVSQWRRRFPDSTQLQAYLHGESNER